MPALLIHGSLSSGMMWRGLKPFLPQPARAIDLHGALGRTRHTDPRDWHMQADVRMIVEHIRKAGEPMTLVGHSYGGFLALHVARQHPELVAHVIAHEPVVWGLFRAGPPEDQARLALLGDLLAQDPGSPEAWLGAFVDYWGGEGSWDAMGAGIQRVAAKSFVKTRQELTAIYQDTTTRSEWAALPCPVLITVGHGTPEAEERLVNLLSDTLPRVSVARVPGGHHAPLTEVHAVGAACAAWLEQQTGSS